MTAPDLAPLPLTTISGYLGAGKTTLVNRLLAAPHGLAVTVLVNDFGAVALDDALVAARDGDVVTLANGCMCCQLGGALYDTLDRILVMRREGRRIDHLVVETSGVADPEVIAALARAEPELAAGHTVVLVDAVNWAATLRDPRLADTLVRQAAAATVLVATKGDLAGGQAVAELVPQLNEIAPGRPVLRGGRDADLAFEALLATDMVPADPTAVAARPLSGAHRPGGLYESWSWQGEARVGREALEELLKRDDLGAWRIKGVVDTPDGPVVAHRAGAQVEIAAVPALPGINAGGGRARMVAIGSPPRFSPRRMGEAWQALVAAGA